MFKTSTLQLLIVLAGFAELALALSSLAIPHLLGWREELRALRPLTRNVFWTYSGYTFGIHIWFAAMSIFAARELAAGGTLATFVTGFIAVYWAVRIIAQFGWYDRSVASQRVLFRVAEAAYLACFAALTLIYGAAALHGMRP